MRIVSDVIGMTPDEVLKILPPDKKAFALYVLEKRRTRSRPRPSKRFIDKSTLLTSAQRCILIDKIALLVDENIYGRSNMCQQFAALAEKALIAVGLPASAVVGTSTYLNRRGEILFIWKHAWVTCGDEVIDANVDVLFENPAVPRFVSVPAYWGPVGSLPKDRLLSAERAALPEDDDVNKLWWPELTEWLAQQNFRTSSPIS